MFRCAVVGVVLIGAMLAGCSSSEPLTIELSHSQQQPSRPFAASGPAVDEGVVCPGGRASDWHHESIDGEVVTERDWEDMFDAAMADGGVAEMYVFSDCVCDDGSGTFTMKFHNQIDFATFEFEGQQDVGTWEIAEGTDSYSDFGGSGDAMVDLDADRAVYTGEIQP